MVDEVVKFGNKEYRLVPARIKQFREENPNGDIDTNPTYNADGSDDQPYEPEEQA